LQPIRTVQGAAKDALVAALAAALLLSPACAHGPAAAPAAPAAVAPPAPAPVDPKPAAQARAIELRARLKAEAEAAWSRWTQGRGPLPAEAPEPQTAVTASSLSGLRAAAAASSGNERRAHELVLATITPRAVWATAGAPALAFERARAGLVFALPGEGKAEHGERDLDRLLTDEPSDQRRHAIAEAEGRAASALAPLALARDAALEEAARQLGAGSFEERVLLLHGVSAASLARLAERTLEATDALADQAVASCAQRNLGLTPDRVQRADLARLVRTGAADAELAAGKGWDNARQTLLGLGADLVALSGASATSTEQKPRQAPQLLVDAAVAQGKAARPLALLVDPPGDVRLSLRPAGGLDEQRALLHESTRALAGVFTAAPRWELAALGDGTAASGTAFLVESLSGDPRWLRDFTSLRGQALDDVVHAEATHRLLSVRRAAALVLFELGRRGLWRPAPVAAAPAPAPVPAPAVEAVPEAAAASATSTAPESAAVAPAAAPPALLPAGPLDAAATAALYRQLLQRATRSSFSEADAGRWPLEADPWLRPAATLRSALFAARLGGELEQESAAQPAPGPWWRSPAAGARLRSLWAAGRSLRAEDAAPAAPGSEPAPQTAAPLAALFGARLGYHAPDAPPPATRPDYKFMQGDRKPKRKAKAKAGKGAVKAPAKKKVKQK
jgi:hypothetical protein